MLGGILSSGVGLMEEKQRERYSSLTSQRNVTCCVKWLMERKIICPQNKENYFIFIFNFFLFLDSSE